MQHFRGIIFGKIENGLSDEEILKALWEDHSMEFTIPRVANYRELYDRLSPSERAEFVEGKRDLLGQRV